jgi:hypothetical protein
MKKVLFRLGLPSILLLALAVVAIADSPHFQYANASVSQTGALTVSFKEVGLGTGTTSVTITVTVDVASATFQCWNNGGKHPKAGNKETVSSSLVASGQFAVRNGQTTASLTLQPPGPGSFSCPSGQSLFLEQVTYSGISVADAGSASLAATPDPISGPATHIPVP